MPSDVLGEALAVFDWAQHEKDAVARAILARCDFIADPGVLPTVGDRVYEAAHEMAAEIRRLRERLEAAEQDTARLDWLQEQSQKFYVDVHGKCQTEPPHGWCVLCWGDSSKLDERGVPEPDGPFAENVATLRAAIDAAREQESPDAE